jgi:hypothetical protein
MPAPARRTRARPARKGGRRTRRRAAPPRGRFVGRDPSPVLDRYPPKTVPGTAPALAGGGPSPAPPPPRIPAPPSAGGSPPTQGQAGAGPSPPPEGLIRLERPFDVDEFSRLLGETAVRVTVPRDALPEVLRRVTEFMGFGIYVYAITVRPSPSELLKGFVVELQRVDYDPSAKAWRPFVERGTVEATDGGPAGGP